MPLDGQLAARIAWAPQPGQQHKLVTCPYMEILFGGARGGGKTDGVLGKWAVKAQRYGVGFNGVFFRKEMPQAERPDRAGQGDLCAAVAPSGVNHRASSVCQVVVACAFVRWRTRRTRRGIRGKI